MKYHNLHKGNIDNLLDVVKSLLAENEREIQILYGNDETGADDILDWQDEDFDAYEKSLLNVAELLIEEFLKNEPVHFSVLTNLILNEKPVIVGEESQFLFCKHCVCGACIPDTFLFKATTNVDFIPPLKFCRRSFVEYRVGKLLMSRITPSIQMPDIDYKEYMDIIFRMYGNTLGIGAEDFGV